jgi:hypothetical protein
LRPRAGARAGGHHRAARRTGARPAGPPRCTWPHKYGRFAARSKLDMIDRRRLNSGKRADYDSARRFMDQAEGAVKANNLLLAQSSVEKAETLADGLR